MPDQPINDRIAYLEKRQSLLASAVSDMQRVLYEQVLEEIDGITEDPARLDSLFRKFTNTTHAKVIKQFAGDILSVGKLNDQYFQRIAEDVTAKDYAPIKQKADRYLLDRFGLTPKGEMVKDGFISTFVEDPTVKRQLKEFAYKSQSSGVGLQEFKKGFKEIITGTPEKNGAFERFYSVHAYDTYQQADASIQEVYAEELQLQAALYLGGKVSGTRPFCNERNGNVYLRSEIADWKDLKFAGKPANYNPFTDRGGYNCRHHYNYITNKQAIRRRPDLEEDENGNLRVKGGPVAAAPVAKTPERQEPEFTPAKTTQEAETWAKDNLKTRIESYKGFDLEVANQTNKSLFEIEQAFIDVPQTSIGTKVMGKAYGQYDWNSNTVNIRKRYDGLDARRIQDNATWRKQYGEDYHASTSLDGVIKHEFAHAFDNQTGRKLLKELQTLPLPVKNDLYGISGYASSDRFYATGGATESSEMIAEVICAKLTKSPKYDKLPDSARSIIDKYFK